MNPQPAIFPIPSRDYLKALKRAVSAALAEDVGSGDRTTEALVLRGQKGRSQLVARERGVLAGADAFAACFMALDRSARLTWHVREGGEFRAASTIVTIRGDSAALLTAERTAVNFIAHLSGVATSTRQLVNLLPTGTKARLLDTRKTTPGLRLLEKRATLLGGAVNHRLGLHDALMIKDNHIAAVGDLAGAVSLGRQGKGRHIMICEVQDLAETHIALEAGASWLLFDNFRLVNLRKGVQLARAFAKLHHSRVICEASGRVTAGSIARIARTGVDFISVGRITHSAPAIDFSLEWLVNPRQQGRGAR